MEATRQQRPGDTSLSMLLATMFEDFVHYQNLKDMPALLGCLHEESPAYGFMEQSLESLLDHYTLQIDVVDGIFGGNDGTYAYYRFQQKIEKIAGPEFQDTLAENLIVFRQNGTDWKIWHYLPLWMRPL